MTAPQPDREPSLATPLERLVGVGTARAEKLAKLGLVTVRDAVMHFPRDYRDFSGAHAVADRCGHVGFLRLSVHGRSVHGGHEANSWARTAASRRPV